jgi:hypothetical protein
MYRWPLSRSRSKVRLGLELTEPKKKNQQQAETARFVVHNDLHLIHVGTYIYKLRSDNRFKKNN